MAVNLTKPFKGVEYTPEHLITEEEIENENAEDYKEPEEDESTEDYNVFSFSDENETVTICLTAEESGLLAKCLDNILANKTCDSDEYKVLIEVIRKLNNA